LTRSVTVTNLANAKLDFIPIYQPPSIGGISSLQIGRTNTLSFSALPGAVEYQWRRFELLPPTPIGAENGTNGVIISQLPGYAVIESGKVNSGKAAYQLAIPKLNVFDPSQYITLSSPYIPGADSSLRFASRLGWTTSDERAEVQVSTNSGATW